jgi:hypothetical protein
MDGFGLFGTSQSRERSEEAKTDKHAAAETPTEVASNATTQYGCSRTGNQSIDAVGYRGDCHEEKPKHHGLKHGRRKGTQELREKGSKENRSFRVEQGNNQAVTENSLD